MSSTDGLAMLKNWQNSGAVVVLTSATLKGIGTIFDVRVKVLSVDDSKLVLLNMDSPGETKTVDLRGAEFSMVEAYVSALELTFADGKKTLIREE